MQSTNWKKEILGNHCFIIAELSANHGGSLKTAIETIKAAKRAGADAVKLQTYTADTLTIDSKRNDFIINSGTIWDGKTFYDLYKHAYTPWEWHEDLFQAAAEVGLVCFSSPFDRSAVDFLENFNPPMYKIASFEITDIPLIKYVASKGKPIIISTGIATKEDIQLAIETCKETNNDKIALLKCTSSYPAPLKEANLLMIKDFEQRFNVVAGLSDHTTGIVAPVVAVSMGAKIIEKHFILDKTLESPDASFSLDEQEFSEMVTAVRNAEKSLGEIDYTLTAKQESGRDFCRSLYVVDDISEGELITEKNLRSIRPGFGMHPKYLAKYLNTVSTRNWKKGDRFIA